MKIKRLNNKMGRIQKLANPNHLNNTTNKINIKEPPLKGKYHVETTIREVVIPNPDEVRRKEKSTPSPWQNEKGEFIF